MREPLEEAERSERRENWGITGSIVAAALVVSWMILFVSLSPPHTDGDWGTGGHGLRLVAMRAQS